jgi:aspartoacylase
VGGTHGNELVGVYLIKKFEQTPELVRRSSFETLTLVGNPRAVEANVRYIDKDLNRCFNFQQIKHSSDLYETQRAKEISDEFGQVGRMPIDLVIDQHCTTSNVGVMLILDHLDSFTLNLVAYLIAIQPTLKVYSSVDSGRNQDSLRSIAKYRIAIEVGPIAHGTLQAELFQKTEALIYAVLDYVEHSNSKTVALEKTSLLLYQYVGSIDYPRNEKGEIQAMIHSQLQFKDYEPLKPGDPIFLTFDGKTIAYQGDEIVYPVFINEAAYYEKGIAMSLTKQQKFQVGYQA